MSDNEEYRTLPDNVCEWPKEYRILMHPKSKPHCYVSAGDYVDHDSSSGHSCCEEWINACCSYDPSLLRSPPEYDGCLYAIHIAYAYARTAAVTSCAIRRPKDDSSSLGDSSSEEICECEHDPSMDIKDSLVLASTDGCINFYDWAKIASVLNIMGDLVYVGKDPPSITTGDISSATATQTTTSVCEGDAVIEGEIDDQGVARREAEKKIKNTIDKSLSLGKWGGYPKERIRKGCELTDSSSSSSSSSDQGELCNILSLDYAFAAAIFERSKIANWYLSYMADPVFHESLYSACFSTSLDFDYSPLEIGDPVRILCHEGNKTSIGASGIFSKDMHLVATGLSLVDAVENKEADPVRDSDFGTGSFPTPCGASNFLYGKAFAKAKLVLVAEITTTLYKETKHSDVGCVRVEYTECVKVGSGEIYYVPTTTTTYNIDKKYTHTTKHVLLSLDIDVVYDAENGTVRRKGLDEYVMITAEEIISLAKTAATGTTGSSYYDAYAWRTIVRPNSDCMNPIDQTDYSIKSSYESACISIYPVAVFCETPYLRIE